MRGKLTTEDADAIRIQRRGGTSVADLVKLYGVCRATIYNVCRRITHNSHLADGQAISLRTAVPIHLLESGLQNAETAIAEVHRMLSELRAERISEPHAYTRVCGRQGDCIAHTIYLPYRLTWGFQVHRYGDIGLPELVEEDTGYKRERFATRMALAALARAT